jgi:ribose 5-phosphate isomerase B
MKLGVASDHAGFGLKEDIKKLLESEGHSVEDFGCYNEESCDYPDYAHKLSEALAENSLERGVFVCGTGLGMSYTANRYKGVRAALCTSAEMAKMSREHNDANALVLGSRIIEADLAREILKVWLETPFEGGRHLKRIRKIDGLK